jgi:hypothetical protein
MSADPARPPEYLTGPTWEWMYCFWCTAWVQVQRGGVVCPQCHRPELLRVRSASPKPAQLDLPGMPPKLP